MNRLQDARKQIESNIHCLLEETGRPIRPLKDEDLLFADIGLDSLDLAQIIVLSEQQFGIDPFRTNGVVVRTFGDLVGAYDRVVQ